MRCERHKCCKWYNRQRYFEPYDTIHFIYINNTEQSSEISERLSNGICFLVFHWIETEKRNAVGPPDNVQVDAALDHLIDSTLAAMGYKSVTHNRGKNINRHHEIDGRSHEKSQNNGSNLTNDGHMESESISASNNQIDTAHEFMVTETATAADHTQADWKSFTNCKYFMNFYYCGIIEWFI